MCSTYESIYSYMYMHTYAKTQCLNTYMHFWCASCAFVFKHRFMIPVCVCVRACKRFSLREYGCCACVRACVCVLVSVHA